MLRKIHGNAIVLAAAARRRKADRRKRASIENARDARLRQLVRFAARTVPHYRQYFRENGIDARDIRSAEDLKRLPLLDKETVRADPERFCSESRRGADAIRFTTSGSTGKPVVFYHDRRSILENIAHGESERAVITGILGRTNGYRTVRIDRSASTYSKVDGICTQNTLIPGKPPRRRIDVSAPLDTVVERIRELKPDVLHSYGSYLEMLFRYLQENRVRLPLPRLVVYGADGMTLPGRALVTEGFGIPVAAVYNAVESFKIGFQCGHGAAYHVHEDLCHLRIVDQQGKDLVDGTAGEVIITNLVNRGTVLLNYRLGDVAAIEPEPCACGRSFRRLRNLEGRVEDMIVLENGNFLHPRAVWAVLREAAGLLRYQFIQHGHRRCELRLLTSDSDSFDRLVATAVPGLQSLLGGSIELDVLRVDELPPDPSGKFRAVVSRCRTGVTV